MQIFNMVSLIRIQISGIFVGVLLCIPMVVRAHVPNIIVQDSLKDIEVITDPELSQAFYGELSGFPHTYEIQAKEPFTLFTQILQPDIESSKNNISGLVIKDRGRGSRVEKIVSLKATDGLWETSYEPFGGDTYRNGPSFERTLDPGIYRIEVNTPNNVEKYVLVVGKREEMTLGYFELVGRIAEVKVFFGKSKFRVIESPFVYVPVLILGVIIGYIVYRKRRKERHV